MKSNSDHLIQADDFLRRMKNGEAIWRKRLEEFGYSFKRNSAETYCETDYETEWRTKFVAAAEKRRRRLENENLSIEELIEESEDQLLEAFAYFLCLTPEQQARTAQQFKRGLERVMALRESNREKARRMLEKQAVRNV